MTREVCPKVVEHPRRRHIHERHRLGIQYDGPNFSLSGVLLYGIPDMVGVGEEEPALHPQHSHPRHLLVLGMPGDSVEGDDTHGVELDSYFGGGNAPLF